MRPMLGGGSIAAAPMADKKTEMRSGCDGRRSLTRVTVRPHRGRHEERTVKYTLLPAGLLAGLAIAAAASCVPIFDTTPGDDSSPPTSTSLSIAVITPESDRTVTRGELVSIEWSTVNLTEDDAIVDVLVRSRDDGAESIVAGAIFVGRSGGLRETLWDTSTFTGGQYTILARIRAGDLSDESIGPGRVAISTTPTFTFLEPATDATLEETTDPNDPNAAPDPAQITIRWSAFDPDGDGIVNLELDEDDDPANENEIVILADRTIPNTDGFDTLDWTGEDSGGETVAGGTYILRARVSDEFNGEQIIPGLARIIVPEQPDDEIALAVTEPAEKTDMVGLGSITIKYTLNESEDVLIDLKADPDEDHENGNELLVLAQRLVETGTTEGEWPWDGLLAQNLGTAPTGIFRIIIVVNRKDGSHEIAESDGLVVRRDEEQQATISLLEPASDRTVTAGDSVNIQWRDEDTSDANTLIRFTLDDDPITQEFLETGEPEFEIFSGREAKLDGVSDTLNYQIPGSLAPGLYYIHAYIDRDGLAPIDDDSTAAGRIIIKDPTQSP